MTAITSIIVFIVSLIVMVKGADWFLDSAERIGLVIGLSPFIVGVTIVGMGTSLPELFSSIFSVLQGAPDIVIANAVGSNIANILLVVGVSSIVGKKLFIDKDLVYLDLPLLVGSTILFLVTVADGTVTFYEAIFLVAAYIIYLLYSVFHVEEDKLREDEIIVDELPGPQPFLTRIGNKVRKVRFNDILFLVVGAAGLVFGAQYLIQSVVSMSQIFNIATGVIAASAVAFGTSLPELLVSVRAALQGKSAVALGNIFGSNIFNLLMVVGIPGLITALPVEESVYMLGLPFLIIATGFFVMSGMSRKVHMWEGSFYVLIYVLYIGKLFGIM